MGSGNNKYSNNKSKQQYLHFMVLATYGVKRRSSVQGQTMCILWGYDSKSHWKKPNPALSRFLWSNKLVTKDYLLFLCTWENITLKFIVLRIN